MNSADLLSFTRDLLSDDGAGQFLISDNVIYQFLADAQFTFCNDTRCFVDQLVIPSVIDQSDYSLPTNTLRIYGVNFDEYDYPYFNGNENKHSMLATSPESCWRYYRTNLATRRLTLNPAPTKVADINIHYVRGPAARLSALVDPEIDEEYHTALAHYAVAQCEHIFDSELNIPRFARIHLGIWTTKLRQAVLHYRRLTEGAPIRFEHKIPW